MTRVSSFSPWFDDVKDRRSAPALQGKASADFVIVGGGMVGLLTAWHLSKLGHRVILIEKNHIGTGDSGATTGFLTRIPDASLLDLEKKVGRETVKTIFNLSSDAQRRLFDLITEEKISCDFLPCSSYWGSTRRRDSVLADQWDILQAVDPKSAFNNSDPPLPFVEAICIPKEGRFHSRKFLMGLLPILQQRGLVCFEESEVVDYDLHDDGIILRTPEGQVTAKAIICATGQPLPMFPELRSLVSASVTTVVGFRTATPRPSPDVFWDTSHPYYYFRQIGDRSMILGGSDTQSQDAKITIARENLESFQRRHFGKGTVTHCWSGSLFETSDGLPVIFEHPHLPQRCFVATGFGGNGLVFGFAAAQTLTDLVQQRISDRTTVFSLDRLGIRIAPPSPRPKPSTHRQWATVAKTADLPPDGTLCANADGTSLALFHINGNITALDNTCSHAGGSLCEGTLEGSVVQCPLHGARFDVRTGEVKGLPAVRPQTVFPTRISNDNIEVEIGNDDTSTPSLRSARPRTWGLLLRFSLMPIALWIIEFLVQVQWLIPDETAGSLVRSFALTGATLIGLALFSSAIFKWQPRWAKHWRLRRYLGVWGFLFITLHVASADYYLFNFDLRAIYYSFNPLKNPIIFGSVGLLIFLAMAATSTDWAVKKLGGRRWKRLHQLVYLGYWGAIFHFLTINPALLTNPPGILLLMITGLALFGQLFWFFKIAGGKHFRSIGTAIGLAIIALYLVTGFLVYRAYFKPASTLKPSTANANADLPLDEAVTAMLKEMKTLPSPPKPSPEPSPATPRELKPLRTGQFQNLNYMSSGTVTLINDGTAYRIVFEENFETPNGPDLVVFLTKNSSPTNRENIASGVQLGKLQSTTGRQEYAIPNNIDPNDFASVSIHCRAFNVPWSYAPFN